MFYREIIVVCAEIHTDIRKYSVWTERGIFRRLRKTAHSDYYLHVCPSVSSHETRFPLDGLSLHFILGYFSKI